MKKVVCDFCKEEIVLKTIWGESCYKIRFDEPEKMLINFDLCKKCYIKIKNYVEFKNEKA